jgi:hypothetical protein
MPLPDAAISAMQDQASCIPWDTWDSGTRLPASASTSRCQHAFLPSNKTKLATRINWLLDCSSHITVIMTRRYTSYIRACLVPLKDPAFSSQKNPRILRLLRTHVMQSKLQSNQKNFNTKPRWNLANCWAMLGPKLLSECIMTSPSKWLERRLIMEPKSEESPHEMDAFHMWALAPEVSCCVLPFVLQKHRKHLKIYQDHQAVPIGMSTCQSFSTQMPCIALQCFSRFAPFFASAAGLRFWTNPIETPKWESRHSPIWNFPGSRPARVEAEWRDFER